MPFVICDEWQATALTEKKRREISLRTSTSDKNAPFVSAGYSWEFCFVRFPVKNCDPHQFNSNAYIKVVIEEVGAVCALLCGLTSLPRMSLWYRFKFLCFPLLYEFPVFTIYRKRSNIFILSCTVAMVFFQEKNNKNKKHCIKILWDISKEMKTSSMA